MKPLEYVATELTRDKIPSQQEAAALAHLAMTGDEATSTLLAYLKAYNEWQHGRMSSKEFNEASLRIIAAMTTTTR